MLGVFFGGMLLGLIFFGGLYLSVQRIGRVKNPGPLMLVGGVLRMAVLLCGLYFLGSNDIYRFLAALAGVVVVKFVIIIWVSKKSQAPQSTQRKE